MAIPHAADMVYNPESPVVASGNGTSWSVPTASNAPASVAGPGELRIKERRSWRTWHLVAAMAVCLLVGMVIGNSHVGTASSSQPNKPTYTLPPPAGSGGTGTSTTGTTATSTTSDTTSATTSPATTIPGPTGTVAILLGPTAVTQGSWTSTPFTVASSPWKLGWAYACTPAPASGPAFQVFAYPVGGSPGSTPVVNETAASGNNITDANATGTLVLGVVAPSSCSWHVQVTGVG